MGLFRKRNDEELAELRAEVRAMHDQLQAAEQTNADLNERVGRLGERNDELAERLATIDEARTSEPGTGGSPAPALPEPVPSPLPPPPTTEASVGGRVDRIEERLAALDEHTEQIDGRLDEVAAQTAKLDDRVTNISTELANQLTELSTDLDYIAQGLPPASGTAPVDPEVIAAKVRQEMDEEIDAKLGIELDDVRANAERLAMEQARYEIQFRQDLAELADRLRRPRSD